MPRAIVVIVLALVALPHPGRGEEPGGDPFSDPAIGEMALPLAQCALAESGGHTPDVVAIVWVIGKRARQAGIPPAEMARRYCRIHRDEARGPGHVRRHRRWLLELGWQRTQAQPPSWPGGRWSAMEEIWRRTQLLVLLIVSGELDDPCPQAFHWGSAQDGQPTRTHAVSCGATRNLFWSRPGRGA